MEETIKKEGEKVEEVHEKPKKVRIKLKAKLYFWLENKLKKYDLLAKQDESLDYWYFDNIKKPLFNWIRKIILSAIPIFLVLLCFLDFKWYFPQMSIGIAITWFLVIEFVKDMKRVK